MFCPPPPTDLTNYRKFAGFKFPFILIGKSTMAFLKSQSWRGLRSWYTRGGPEQGFQRCFADGLNQSLVSSEAQANPCIVIYCASIDRGLSELEPRFSGNDQEMPWKISVTVKQLIKKVSPALLNFTKWTAGFRGTQREYSSKPLKHRILKLF